MTIRTTATRSAPSSLISTSSQVLLSAAFEPVIGHLKDDHRMRRNYLKGRDGDRTNAVHAAAGYNIEQEIAAILLDAIWISSLLRAGSGCALLAAGIPHRIRYSNLSGR